MKKSEVKQLWLDALRSGEYTQVKGILEARDENGDITGHCCLGVLSDLYCKHVEDIRVEEELHSRGYLNSVFGNKQDMDFYSAYLHPSVRSWVGLISRDGYHTNDYNKSSKLTLENDCGKSFNDIADIIETNPTLWDDEDDVS